MFFLYIEYLDRKSLNIKNPVSQHKSGLSPELKRIARQTAVGIGILSGVIIIKNEFINQEKKQSNISRSTINSGKSSRRN